MCVSTVYDCLFSIVVGIFVDNAQDNLEMSRRSRIQSSSRLLAIGCVEIVLSVAVASFTQFINVTSDRIDRNWMPVSQDKSFTKSIKMAGERTDGNKIVYLEGEFIYSIR